MSMNNESLQLLGSLETVLRDPGRLLSPDELRGFREQLHTLHIHSIDFLAKGRKGLELEEGLHGLLEISANLLTFLTSLQDTADSVSESEKAMLFGSGSALAGMLEEFITGEDPFQDLLFNVIPFVLGRLSEKAYIDSSMAGFSNLLQDHAILIRDGYWELVKNKVREGSGDRHQGVKQMTEDPWFHAIQEAVRQVL